jgi:hypothetical protein
MDQIDGRGERLREDRTNATRFVPGIQTGDESKFLESLEMFSRFGLPPETRRKMKISGFSGISFPPG